MENFLGKIVDIFNFKIDPRFSEGIANITSQLAFIFTADSVFPTLSHPLPPPNLNQGLRLH